MLGDFLGGQVAKTLNSQCREPGFDPRSGNNRFLMLNLRVYMLQLKDPVCVWQKPTQQCKATILQLQINTFRKRSCVAQLGFDVAK